MYAHIHTHKHKRQVERINEKPKMKIPSKKNVEKRDRHVDRVKPKENQ